MKIGWLPWKWPFLLISLIYYIYVFISVGFLFIPFCSSLKHEVLEPSDCSWSHLVVFFCGERKATFLIFSHGEKNIGSLQQICLSWLERQTRREWEGSWNEVDSSMNSLFSLPKARLISKTNLWSIRIQHCTEFRETLWDLCRSMSLDQSMTSLVWILL